MAKILLAQYARIYFSNAVEHAAICQSIPNTPFRTVLCQCAAKMIVVSKRQIPNDAYGSVQTFRGKENIQEISSVEILMHTECIR